MPGWLASMGASADNCGCLLCCVVLSCLPWHTNLLCSTGLPPPQHGQAAQEGAAAAAGAEGQVACSGGAAGAGANGCDAPGLGNNGRLKSGGWQVAALGVGC